MKLSRLYSNNPAKFPLIDFNGVDDNRISVIFARVKKPKDSHKDSHNLGKTLLIDLIDFLLLKNLAKVPNHFLSKHAFLFADWTFYLDVRTNKGHLITIRRSVKDPTKISFRFVASDAGNKGRRNSLDSGWNHENVALERAVQLLDAYLELDSIKPFTYRQGVGYLLRTQADYRDLFQLSKNLQGSDVEWKPYLGNLFGLDSELLKQKYELDDEITALKRAVDELQASIPKTRTKNLNELRMELSSKTELLQQVEGRIDRFKFAQEEIRLSKVAADELETEVAELNERLANVDYDLAQMQGSIQKAVMFDLSHIETVFKETNTFFPHTLKKGYEDLVNFNRAITSERSKFLKQQIRQLSNERDELIATKYAADERRSQLYQAIHEHDTFKKFKALQKEQASQRAELEQKKTQIKLLEQLLAAEQSHKAKQAERVKIVEKIESSVAIPTDIQHSINKEFARMVSRVLNLSGSVFLRMNQQGNIEPQHTADPINVDAGQSSQSEGNTYKRLLCILFDIAVLKAFRDRSFFRFVYHDGILETMDDRKKIELMSLLRETAAETGIQFIFSAIEAELPLAQGGKRQQLPEGDIIRELSDEGAKGRLFRMPPF